MKPLPSPKTGNIRLRIHIDRFCQRWQSRDYREISGENCAFHRKRSQSAHLHQPLPIGRIQQGRTKHGKYPHFRQPIPFARLTELINEDLPIDVSKAASILRDHKGLQNTDLGLANEMAINQFIAHHSVIFQPEKRLMWVSTSPWQCGKYVAYDLNKIFKDTINWQHEIYSSNLTIPEDKFIDTPEFQHLLTYKKLTPLLLKKIRKKEQIEESVLKTYQASNPSLYYVYEVIGDYYEAMQQPQQAIAYWQQALKKSIPKLQEKERIQQKIQKQSKDGKES